MYMCAPDASIAVRFYFTLLHLGAEQMLHNAMGMGEVHINCFTYKYNVTGTITVH